MTTIAAWKSKTEAWIGGDSGLSDGTVVNITTEPKVWRAQGWLLGYCGAPHLGEKAKLSGIGDPGELRDYLLAYWEEHGVALGDNDTGIMVLNQTGIYYIDSYFAVTRCRENYMAVGEGGPFAIGALYACKDDEMPPRDRIHLALSASLAHSAHARKPFRIIGL